MGYTAKWGPKGFLVSEKKIVPLGEVSTSITMKTDNGEDTSGTPPTNTRGRELQPVSFSTTYLRSAGVDPEAQFKAWGDLVGESYPLYIGNKRFGPKKLMLNGVDATMTYAPNGLLLKADLTLNFEEYSEGGTSKLAAASASGGGGSVDAAMGATASRTDKTMRVVALAR